MNLSQCVNRAVQLNPQKCATVFGERKHTWAQFKERVSCLAQGLKELGVESDDRVAILALNSDRYLEHFFGAPWAGGIIVPINIRLAPPEIIFTLNDSGTKLLVVDDTFAALLPALKGKMDTVTHIIFTGDGKTPEGCVNHEDLIRNNQPAEDAGRCDEDIAGLFYTGGTTGRSKGVMLTHNNLLSNALNIIPALQINEQVVYLHSAPMFHLADCASTFAVTLAGGSHSFIPKFDPEETLKTIVADKVTNCLLVPTMLNILINMPNFANYDLSGFRKIMYGASPMPEAVLLKAMELLPDCEFAQGYGMTEASPLITFLEAKYHTMEGPYAGRLNSAGRAGIAVELKVADENDDEVPRGQVGEVLSRGPHVMKGYWNMEDLSRETLRGGWLHTGDMAYMDEDGFIFIVDRSKDMIISGGENVYSTETENAIYHHPAVRECAVIGIPDKDWGEQVHAVVVLHEGQELTADELKKHCAELIAGFKCPRSISFQEEPLPVSGAGKILKTNLRKPYWKGQDKKVN